MTETETETDRERDRETERQTERDGETERERGGFRQPHERLELIEEAICLITCKK